MAAPAIHPTAVVASSVELADGVTVGPYAVIEGAASIGAGTTVFSHSVINGSCRIGARCRIGPGAYVGLDAQSRAYKGGDSWLIVGDDNIIREGASLHRSMHEEFDHATRVGNRCF